MADLMKFSNRVLYFNLNLMRVVQDWGLESCPILWILFMAFL